MSTREPEVPAGESFAAMFEADAKSRPRKGAGRALGVGAQVEGVVVRVGRDAVFVDLDGKQEGYLERHELAGPDGALTVTVGDTLRAVVIDVSQDGNVRLATSAPRGRGAEGLLQAKDAGLPVEGLVTGVNKGGLEVTIEGIRAFCPARQADTHFVTDMGAFAGQKLHFLVTAVKDGGRDVVLSRRAFLERESADARAKLMEKLVPGAVLRGKVVSTTAFGAFVDLGGVEGLLPLSELSHDRGARPDDVVKIGDEIDVRLLEMKPDEKRPGQQRITLSLKALAADPWDSIAPTLTEGTIREGRVMRTAAFGVFVQLAPGLDGLLHVSELSGELGADGQPVAPPKVGEAISVRVQSVDLVQRRVSLALATSTPGDRPAKARPTPSVIQQGSVVTGKVTRIEPYGVFVEIRPGQRGLLSAQELQKGKGGADLHKLCPLGTEVKAKVVAIDATGKIRLSVEALKTDEERASFEDFRARETERAGTGKLGALGEKMKKAGLLAAPAKAKKK